MRKGYCQPAIELPETKIRSLRSKRVLFIFLAAHCVTFPSTNQKRNEASLRVYLGKYFRPADKNNEYVQSIAVNKIVVHHKYNYAQLENDIALLRLQHVSSYATLSFMQI